MSFKRSGAGGEGTWCSSDCVGTPCFRPSLARRPCRAAAAPASPAGAPAAVLSSARSAMAELNVMRCKTARKDKGKTVS